MHTDHTQVVNYMRKFANASDRIQIETTGYTFQNRPLQLLTISSPKNLDNFVEIFQIRNAISYADANDSAL